MRSIRNEKEENKKNTRIMFLNYFLTVIGIGAIIEFFIYLGFIKSESNPNISEIIPFLTEFMIGYIAFFGLYTLITLISMRSHAIRAVGGYKVKPNDGFQVYNIVEELALQARLPMPDVYIVNDPSPNAFAMGYKLDDSLVAVTTGLLEIMNREELEAVIGHELSHIKNGDMKLSSYSVALAATFSGLGYMLFRSGLNMMFSGRYDDDSSNNAGTVLGLAMVATSLAFILIGIPISYVIKQSISRQREYLADVSSAEITLNPESMIKALQKLKDLEDTPTIQDTALVRALCLNEAKYLQKGKRIVKNRTGLLSTHPPLDERINRLKELTGETIETYN